MNEDEYKKFEQLDKIDIDDDILNFINELYIEKTGDKNKSTKKEDN